jgi:hypothetical protein
MTINGIHKVILFQQDFSNTQQFEVILTENYLILYIKQVYST